MIALNTQVPEKPADVHPDGSLEVFKIWRTIQGEGPFAGQPAIFVRLAGCNLQCPDCFGIGTKSRIPYLSRSYGPKIRLDEVREGERLLTFDEDFVLVETEVERVLTREVDHWLEVRIDGRVYDVTPEHPFFTTRGLITAGDLRLGDDVLEARPHEIISFKKLGQRNPMKDKGVATRKAASTDYGAVAQKISATRKQKFKAGELIAPYLLMSSEQREAFKRKVSAANRREGNGNWSGKYANWLDVQEAIDRGDLVTCERCDRTDCRLLVHHKDGNHANDERSNLAVWCHRCHNQHHERGYNFWNGRRRDGKQLVKKHNGQKVQKITRCEGRLPVVNLTCAPYPTYLANGMWVHNCDTDYTSSRVMMTPSEILDEAAKLQNWKSRLIVLTGGEPFRQGIGRFVLEANLRNYHVQIETNGTLYRDDLPWHGGLSIVCSPKTPTLNPKLIPRIKAYKYILDADHVDSIDGLPSASMGAPVGIARPDNKGAEVYVQPLDVQDASENRRHIQAAIDSCLQFGYRLSFQVHKSVGVE